MLSRLLGSRRAVPQLSVVVPVYNVEAYLAQCLDSVLAQTFTGTEVVLVDDGSTDGSAAIAAGYVRANDGWSLVTTGNRGLGAARNRGVQEATGEFLAFLDSDDLLPDYAYQLLVSTLRESGSDFAVGCLEQLVDGRRVEAPPWLRQAHLQRRLGLTLEEYPPIMRNVFAWDKVFRRSFYDRIGLSFPEGVRYEDQVAMTEAYARADGFDIVRRPVYIWRVRADGTSITQRRHELADLEDRIATKKLTTEVVRRYGSPQLLEYWARHGLVGDLPLYFQQIPTADEVYWRRLVSGVRELFEELPPIEQSVLRVAMRLVGWLVHEDRRTDAETVLAWLLEHPGPLSLKVEGDHVVAALPLGGDRTDGVPAHVCWLGEHELEHDARLVDVRWEGVVLVITGWGLIRGAPTVGSRTAVVVSAVPRRPGSAPSRVDAMVERFVAPEATAWVGRADQDYDDSGFVARLDVAAALAEPPGDPATSQAGSRAVEVEVRVEGIRRTGRFRSKQPRLDLRRLADRSRPAQVSFSPGDGLTIQAWPSPRDTARAR